MFTTSAASAWCPAHLTEIKRFECACSDSEKIENAAKDECVCKTGYTEKNGVCVCVDGTNRNNATGECECLQHNQELSRDSTSCVCSDGTSLLQGECSCPFGYYCPENGEENKKLCYRPPGGEPVNFFYNNMIPGFFCGKQYADVHDERFSTLGDWFNYVNDDYDVKVGEYGVFMECPMGFWCPGHKNIHVCSSVPGEFCDVGTTTQMSTCSESDPKILLPWNIPTDLDSVPSSWNTNYRPKCQTPKKCPHGYFCEADSGSPITPRLCQVPDGYYCPEGTETAAGTICPAGFFCTGPQPQRLERCRIELVFPGQFCDVGTTTIAAKKACPDGYYCPGGHHQPLPCTALPGYHQTCTCRHKNSQLECMVGAMLAQEEICPVGFFCSGGTLPKQPCQVPAGRFCPEGSVSPDGALCPSGFYCLGGIQEPMPCEAGVGYYYVCPEGSTELTLQPCLLGRACPQDTAGTVKCSSGRGHYCGQMTTTVDGYECPAGFMCPGMKPCPNITDDFCFSTHSFSGSADRNMYMQSLNVLYQHFFLPDDVSETDIVDVKIYDRACVNNCIAGESGFYPSAPTFCHAPPGKYCLGEEVVPCEEGFFCYGGMIDPCDLDTGYFCPAGSSSNQGEACPQGFFCDGRFSRPCPGFWETLLLLSRGQRPLITDLAEGSDEMLSYCITQQSAEYGEKSLRILHRRIFYIQNILGFLSLASSGIVCSHSYMSCSDVIPGCFCHAAPDASSGVEMDCPVGFFCVGGLERPTPCSWQEVQVTDGLLHPPTLPGSYCEKNTPVGGASLICPSGYSCKGASHKPEKCNCAAGFFCDEGTAAADETCQICPVGFYCAGFSSDAEPCNVPAGQYCETGNAVGRQHGVNCSADFFCLGGFAPPQRCWNTSIPMAVVSTLGWSDDIKTFFPTARGIAAADSTTLFLSSFSEEFRGSILDAAESNFFSRYIFYLNVQTGQRKKIYEVPPSSNKAIISISTMPYEENVLAVGLFDGSASLSTQYCILHAYPVHETERRIRKAKDDIARLQNLIDSGVGIQWSASCPRPSSYGPAMVKLMTENLTESTRLCHEASRATNHTLCEVVSVGENTSVTFFRPHWTFNNQECPADNEAKEGNGWRLQQHTWHYNTTIWTLLFAHENLIPTFIYDQEWAGDTKKFDDIPGYEHERWKEYNTEKRQKDRELFHVNHYRRERIKQLHAAIDAMRTQAFSERDAYTSVSPGVHRDPICNDIASTDDGKHAMSVFLPNGKGLVYVKRAQNLDLICQFQVVKYADGIQWGSHESEECIQQKNQNSVVLLAVSNDMHFIIVCDVTRREIYKIRRSHLERKYASAGFTASKYTPVLQGKMPVNMKPVDILVHSSGIYVLVLDQTALIWKVHFDGGIAQPFVGHCPEDEQGFCIAGARDGWAFSAEIGHPVAFAMARDGSALFVADREINATFAANTIKKVSLQQSSKYVQGRFCPAGSRSHVGELCPAGTYCSSGIPRNCTMSVVFDGISNYSGYCHRGSVENYGSFCPDGYICADARADKVECDAAPGMFCKHVATQSVVEECPRGYHCKGAHGGASKCRPGFFSDETGMSSCTSCAAGTYSFAWASTDNEICLVCESGKFSQSGAYACEPCNDFSVSVPGSTECTACAPGSVVSVEDASTCAECGQGKFSGYGNSSCSVCAQGSFSDKGSEVCLPCERGKIMPDFMQVKAICIGCPRGKYSDIGQSECLNCGAGKFSAFFGASFCEACVPGTFADVRGQTACKSCASGKFLSQYGAKSQRECLNCNPGTKSRDGASECESCVAGKYSWLQSGECLPCGRGMYSQSGEESCWLCDPGKFQSQDGASHCQACDSGKFAKSRGQETCDNCAYGMFSNTTGASSCNICKRGTFSRQGSDACSECSTGTFARFEGMSSCQNCSAGHFAETTKSTFCTECRAGTYSSVVAASSRTVCTECAAGKFSAVVASTGIHNCMDCPAGKYSYASGANTSLTCISCLPGKFSVIIGSNNDTCVNCTAGTYQNRSGAFSEASCIPCMAGKYSMTKGASTAVTCLECNAGTFSFLESATFCEACLPGSFSDKPGQTRCHLCYNGTFSGVNGSASCLLCRPGFVAAGTGATVCDSCLPGTASLDSTIRCTDCFPGTYSQTNGASACTECGVGKFLNFSKATTESNCSVCAAGYFSDRNASLGCDICSFGEFSGSGASLCSLCPYGKFSDIQGGPSQNVCRECNVGEFAPTPGLRVCQQCQANTYSVLKGMSACSKCPSGKYAPPGAERCTACSPGKFFSGHCFDRCTAEHGADHLHCLAVCDEEESASSSCTECEQGKFSKYWGSMTCLACPAGSYANSQTSLTKCTLCTPGKYASNSSSGKCDACRAGFFSAGTANTNCTPCPAGQFSALVGMDACSICPAGHYTASAGSASFDACRPGSFSMDGARQCTLCSPGKISPSSAATTCSSCPSGYFSGTNGSSRCESCRPGFFSVKQATSCTICESGKFASVQNSTSCTICPHGKYSGVNGSHNCSLCNPGQFSGAAASHCSSCSFGSYSAEPGAHTCAECTFGKYSPSIAQSVCQNCSPGLFQNRHGQKQCRSCLAGSFSASNASVSCNLCSSGTFSRAGASVCSKCSAAPGFYCSQNSTAPDGEQCPAGYFCPGSTQYKYACACDPGFYCESGSSIEKCVLCPDGQFCSGGVSVSRACAKIAGRHCKFGAANETGVTCTAGHFCDGTDSIGQQCPINSVSAPGSKQGQDCKCPRNFFGRDGHMCIPCPSHSTSTPPFNTYIGQCECSIGRDSYDSCSVCPKGSFGVQKTAADYTWKQDILHAVISYDAADVNVTTMKRHWHVETNMGFVAVLSFFIQDDRDVNLFDVYSQDRSIKISALRSLYQNSIILSIVANDELSSTFCEAVLGHAGLLHVSQSVSFTYNRALNTITAYMHGSNETKQSVCDAPFKNNIRNFPVHAKIDADASLRRLDVFDYPISDKETIDRIIGNADVGWSMYSSSAFTCVQCPKNQTTVGPGATSGAHCYCDLAFAPTADLCTRCPTSTYKANVSNASCTSCLPNETTTTSQNSSNSCECIPGLGRDDDNLCVLCSVGEYGLGGFCRACEQGSFSNATGQTACYLCLQNHSTPVRGARSSDECVCKQGFYQDEQTCRACSRGQYSSRMNQNTCDDCPLGKFMGDSGGSMCHECPIGSFNNQTRATECKQCSPYSTTRATASKNWTDCLCDFGFRHQECYPKKTVFI